MLKLRTDDPKKNNSADFLISLQRSAQGTESGNPRGDDDLCLGLELRSPQISQPHRLRTPLALLEHQTPPHPQRLCVLRLHAALPVLFRGSDETQFGRF